MRVTIYKGCPKGIVFAEPSKSECHRLLVSYMLSKDDGVLENVKTSDDIKATLNCINAYSRNYTQDDETIIFKKESSDNLIKNEAIPIFNCNESGSTLRFFIPIALTKYEHVIFTCTKKLGERGISIYEDLFAKQNIKIIKSDLDNNKVQFEFIGKLKADEFFLRGDVSSQFVTGLLFALPLLEGDSKIIITTELQSKNYCDMTLNVLDRFGITINRENNVFSIKGNQQYSAKQKVQAVEGDYSNASFLAAFNYFGGTIKIKGLNEESLQGDKIYNEYFKTLYLEDSPTLNIENCIDLGPVLFAFATLSKGGHFIGCSRLKIKESNRIEAMKEELAKMGAEIIVNDDDVIIKKTKLHYPTSSFDSHNDHRIAMALSLFSTQFDIQINNAQAVNKSYKDYFKVLNSLGLEIKCD